MTKKVYAVKQGINPGLYYELEEAMKQITGFSGANMRGFKKIEEAEKFLGEKKYEPEIKAFADGSYSQQTGIAGYGVLFLDEYENIILKDMGKLNYFEFKFSANMGAELKAVIRTVELAISNELRNIEIIYDAQVIKFYAEKDTNKFSPIVEEYNYFVKNYFEKLNISLKHKSSCTDFGKYFNMAHKLANKAINI